jgi:hypothetical protein
MKDVTLRAASCLLSLFWNLFWNLHYMMPRPRGHGWGASSTCYPLALPGGTCSDLIPACLPQAYVVGEVGIMDELAAVGIMSFGGPHDNGKQCSFKHEMEHDPQVRVWGSPACATAAAV